MERIQGAALFPAQPMAIKLSVLVLYSLLLAILYYLDAYKLVIEFNNWSNTDNLMAFIFAVISFVWFGIVACMTFIFGQAFYSAMLAPLRWLARQVRATSRIFNDIGTFVARRRSWSLLQEMAFGLEGYSFELPQAERIPTFAAEAIYKYEDLPKNIEERALSNRDEWIRRNFGAVTETFSKLVVTASDLSSLLKIVETDLSLVHAAYYTDDECIERIADWIAGKG